MGGLMAGWLAGWMDSEQLPKGILDPVIWAGLFQASEITKPAECI